MPITLDTDAIAAANMCSPRPCRGVPVLPLAERSGRSRRLHHPFRRRAQLHDSRNDRTAGERMDCTFKAVEGVRASFHSHLESFVVFVTAGFASGHLTPQ